MSLTIHVLYFFGVEIPRCLPETDAVWGIYWPITDDGDTVTVACPGVNVTGKIAQ